MNNMLQQKVYSVTTTCLGLWAHVLLWLNESRQFQRGPQRVFVCFFVIFLSLFLIFGDFEPRCSYEIVQYKNFPRFVLRNWPISACVLIKCCLYLKRSYQLLISFLRHCLDKIFLILYVCVFVVTVYVGVCKNVCWILGWKNGNSRVPGIP